MNFTVQFSAAANEDLQRIFDFLIQRELDAQQLKALPLESGMSNHPRFTLYSHKDKALGPASRILVELIKTYDSCNLDDQP